MASEKRKSPGKKRMQPRYYLIVAANGKLVLVSADTGKVTPVEGKSAARVVRLLKDRQKNAKAISEALEGATLGEVELSIIDVPHPPVPKPK